VGEYALELEYFSGPMDLLLHLVRAQDIPIEHVEMHQICEQYLQIVLSSKSLDLDKAAEYLVIAATLITIKSRSLLPGELELDPNSLNPDDAQGEEFYAELKRRLKLYELTKSRAALLRERPQLGVEVFIRRDLAALTPDPETVPDEGNAQTLGKLFLSLLERVGNSLSNYKIALEPVSVVSFMMKIVDGLGISRERTEESIEQNSKPRTLVEMMKSFLGVSLGKKKVSGQAFSDPESIKNEARSVVIGSFVAVLELMKRGLVTAKQRSSSDAIELTPRSISEDSSELIGGLESEFDEVPGEAPGNAMAAQAENVIELDSFRKSPEQPEIDNKKVNSAG
jgi:segregation and condensation protein A